MVKVADRPEFAEIPALVREGVDLDVRLTVFSILHAEAVAQKDIAPAPATLFDKLPGRISQTLLYVAIGGTVGAISCVIVIYVMRLLVTIV